MSASLVPRAAWCGSVWHDSNNFDHTQDTASLLGSFFYGQHAMTLGNRARALIAGSGVVMVHYIREPLPILP